MQLIMVALAVAAISMTVTRSSLFRGIRERLTLFGNLFKCPYCFAHWVSFCMWCTYPLDCFDFIITVFATVTLSIVPMITIEYLNRLVDKHARFRFPSPARISS